MAEHLRVKSDVCSICIEIFTKPKILACFHSFCYNCLDKYVDNFRKDNKFPCPLCRSEICIPQGGVQKFRNNLYIPENMKAYDLGPDNSKLCEFCQRNRTKLQCQNCEKFVCLTCKLCHDAILQNNNHTIVDITDETPSTTEKAAEVLDKDSENLCVAHNSTKDLFCESCSEFICHKCFVKDHLGHKHLDITSENLRATTKQEFESMQKNIQSQLNDYSNASNSFESKILELPEIVSTYFFKIDAQTLKICNTVTQSAEELKGKVNHWLQEETRRLKKEQQEINIRKHIAEVQSVKLNDTLQKNSFVQMLPNLANLKQAVSTFCEKPLVPLLPIVRTSKFVEGSIISEKLKCQIGCFDVEELPKHDKSSLFEGKISEFKTEIYINDVTTEDDLYYDYEDLPWFIFVWFESGKLYTRIKLDNDYISDDIKKIDYVFTFKLLNALDEKQTIVRKFIDVPVDGSNSRCALIIKDILTHKSRGYLNEFYNFTIQTWVKIIKIEKK